MSTSRELMEIDDEDERIRIENQGTPWKNVVYKKTFKEADAIRIEYLLEYGMQAKVKWMPSMDKFVVKTRRDPFVVAAEKLSTKTNINKRRKKNRG